MVDKQSEIRPAFSEFPE